MKVELIKDEKIDGEIYFSVFVDGDCKKSFFQGEPVSQKGADGKSITQCRAEQYTEELIERLKKGFPVQNVIISKTIEISKS